MGIDTARSHSGKGRAARVGGVAMVAAAIWAMSPLLSSPTGAATPRSARVGAATAPRHGGTITEAVVGIQWPTLDPLTNTQDVSDGGFMDLIYGELFQAGAHGAIMPDIATGYRLVNNGLQLDIFIRPGVTFSDGTPYTAAAVASSINRSFSLPIAQSDFPAFASVKLPVTSSGNTVIVNLKSPNAALVPAFISSAPTWTVDQAALTRMGEQAYGQHPIGAGPFEVAFDSASTKINLVRNPHYWQKGHPYLSGINVVDVGSDDSAYAALESGQVQLTGISTISLLRQAEKSKQFNVIAPPLALYNLVSFNETGPPFNNILAREAVIYATNTRVLVDKLYSPFYKVVQAPTYPGELFFQGRDVPGYKTYNLAKAKALVKQLGGLSFTLATNANTQYWLTEAEVLTTEWAAAGIHAKIVFNSLAETLEQLAGNKWQALDSNWGGRIDPALDVPSFFSSTGRQSGVRNPTLDAMLNQAESVSSPASRARMYKQIYEFIDKNAMADFLYDKPFYTLAAKDIGWLPQHGRTYDEIHWQDVYLNR